ncbi:ORFL288C [Human betaherpesvirus 5]|nr:ORFL288C [Human betaherpesvirus 5]
MPTVLLNRQNFLPHPVGFLLLFLHHGTMKSHR